MARTQVVLNEITDSNYFIGDPTSLARIPMAKHLLGPAISSQTAAAAILSAIRNGKSVHAAPALLGINLALQKHLASLYSYLTTRTAGLRFGP